MGKISPRSICTIQRSGGDFCEQRSLPGAPFPICLSHAAKLLAFLDDVMPRDMDDRIIVAWRSMEQRRAAEAERKRMNPRESLVYYAQVGDRIKIGVTSNLAQRLRSYPPGTRLLGYETGDLSLEAQRHRQFADELEAGREWFRPSPRLLTHIKQVNERRNAA